MENTAKIVILGAAAVLVSGVKLEDWKLVEKYAPEMMKIVDSIYEDLGDLLVGYELKYNKFYIGLSLDGVSKNFLAIIPFSVSSVPESIKNLNL